MEMNLELLELATMFLLVSMNVLIGVLALNIVFCYPRYMQEQDEYELFNIYPLKFPEFKQTKKPTLG